MHRGGNVAWDRGVSSRVMTFRVVILSAKLYNIQICRNNFHDVARHYIADGWSAREFGNRGGRVIDKTDAAFRNPRTREGMKGGSGLAVVNRRWQVHASGEYERTPREPLERDESRRDEALQSRWARVAPTARLQNRNGRNGALVT